MSQPVVPRRDVLVLARPAADLRAISAALERMLLRPVLVTDIAGDGTLAIGLRASLRSAAFIVVVWDVTRLHRAVAFEAGFASGAGLPVVILDARRASNATASDLVIEAFLTGPRMHAKLDDSEALEQELRGNSIAG